MTYGPDAIHELIEESGWSYPVSVRRLEDEHALANLHIDEKGNSLMLSELFVDANIDKFDSRADLERKLDPLFEREREARRVGIVGRIKRAFLGRP